MSAHANDISMQETVIDRVFPEFCELIGSDDEGVLDEVGLPLAWIDHDFGGVLG